MNGYYLTQNMMFNCTHIVKQRWYHKCFGEPSLTIAFTKAVSADIAEKKFKLQGYRVGLGFDVG